ncbi:hypothetical protein TRFO_26930 [Tritrichomonas foetus]|uniref:Uncharacterized protein n=1 Tax=Tritrichomonas foetus TaxID=1144522 RepID=A0A1J4K1P5_9EUKA|nr:hypothetical protein TRFO_26930 [Tritrichomonas foetus]|eukprot:OHT05311.1 hypothetical protein TRFO_26930 [Tritrichomonas foetus]
MENSAGSQSFNDYDKSIPKSDIISFKFIEELEDTKKIDASNTNIVDVKYLNRNDIEEINIQNTPLSDLPFNRLMLLICVGSNLRVINDIPVCSEELELVSTLQEKIRNLLLEGYILTSIDSYDYSYGDDDSISHTPRRHSSNRHKSSKRTPKQSQVNKYEVSPNKNNFYIDEFDDVKKLHRKHSAPSVTGGQLKPSSSTPSKVQLLNEFAFLNNDNLQQTDLFMEPFPKADNPELETAFSPRQKRQRKHHKQHSEASDNSNDGE